MPDASPFRIAVIGAGPAGFYTAEHLLRQDEIPVAVDLFDRLPTPYGLVRGGVAPDHPKIKNVTRVYDRTAEHPGFRFYGNVEFGRHVTLADLQAHYHQVVFTTGSQRDRRMGIPGEDLERSYSATEFVAWYNGHPDYCDQPFDLSVERVVVVGVGNVAVDVCRLLCRTREELARTDIADHALDALAASGVREVVMLGRRGPAQAAFTTPEVKELAELDGADVHLDADAFDDSPEACAWLETYGDRSMRTKLDVLHELASLNASGKPCTLTLRFCVSPVEILDDGAGGVAGVRVAHNRLVYNGERPGLEPTGDTEVIPCGAVFRSIGYLGVPLPDVPFSERSGTIPNVDGRVLNGDARPLPGLYAAGWIKRGPTGVIGTNKQDAAETVASMLDDLRARRVPEPSRPSAEAFDALLRGRQPDVVSFDDWRRIDEAEVLRGQPEGRPRVKFTRVEEMIDHLKRDA